MSGRIQAFAALMETSVTEGTTGAGINQYPNRAPELQRAEGSTYTPADRTRSQPALTSAFFVESLQRNEVGILLTGKYREACSVLMSGATTCTYTRHSGHERTVNGYTAIQTRLSQIVATTIRFYNPWYALIENTTPHLLSNPGSAGDGRPFGAETTYLSQRGHSVDILERFDVIRTQ